MVQMLKTPSGPRALRKGLHILNLLRLAERELSPAEIALAIGVPRPTAYRLLSVLEDEGYVKTAGSRRTYTIASREQSAAKPWGTFLASMKPIMVRIAEHTGDAVFLVCHDGPNLRCLHREIGSHTIQALSLRIGGKSPLGIGAAGIAILAKLEQDEVDAVLSFNSATYFEYGNLQITTIRKLIEACNLRGYSVMGNHAASGVVSVGISLPPTDERPVTAISVIAPQWRMSLARQKEIAKLIRLELSECEHI